MKVRELIEALQKMPPEMEVVRDDMDLDCVPITKVTVETYRKYGPGCFAVDTGSAPEQERVDFVTLGS